MVHAIHVQERDRNPEAANLHCKHKEMGLTFVAHSY